MNAATDNSSPAEPVSETHPTAVGALAGLLPAVPAILILVFVFVGLGSVLAAVGEGGVVVALVGVLLIAVAFLVGIGAGLGALGGYFGGRLAETDGAGT